jgi:hypothetical protein
VRYDRRTGIGSEMEVRMVTDVLNLDTGVIEHIERPDLTFASDHIADAESPRVLHCPPNMTIYRT